MLGLCASPPRVWHVYRDLHAHARAAVRLNLSIARMARVHLPLCDDRHASARCPECARHHAKSLHTLKLVAVPLQLRVASHRDGCRAIGITCPSARWRTISPAMREQAMRMQALVLSSREAARDRQGVCARVRAAHRCFDNAPAVSIAPFLAEVLEQKVELCPANGSFRHRR